MGRVHAGYHVSYRLSLPRVIFRDADDLSDAGARGTIMNITQLLIKHEGLRLKPYRDTVGKLTIGVGRNLDDVGISREEALMLLANDIAERRIGLRNALPWFEKLSETRQDVLINMSFMGLSKLLKFKKMLGYCAQGNYEQAAVQMGNSKWARQVKGRATELIEIMRTDQS